MAGSYFVGPGEAAPSIFPCAHPRSRALVARGNAGGWARPPLESAPYQYRAAVDLLIRWTSIHVMKRDIILRALDAGVSQQLIHEITGLALDTIREVRYPERQAKRLERDRKRAARLTEEKRLAAVTRASIES